MKRGLALPLGAAFILFGISVWRLESVAAAFAFWSLRDLYVGAPEAVIPTTVVAQGLHFGIPVANLTSRPLCIVGAEASCGCLAALSLPLTLKPLSAGIVTVAVSPRSARKEERIRFHTDHGRASSFDVRLPVK